MTNKEIERVADREFGDAEFKAGFKLGQFIFHGRTTSKDLHDHFERMKKVFR